MSRWQARRATASPPRRPGPAQRSARAGSRLSPSQAHENVHPVPPCGSTQTLACSRICVPATRATLSGAASRTGGGLMTTSAVVPPEGPSATTVITAPGATGGAPAAPRHTNAVTPPVPVAGSTLTPGGGESRSVTSSAGSYDPEARTRHAVTVRGTEEPATGSSADALSWSTYPTTALGSRRARRRPSGVLPKAPAIAAAAAASARAPPAMVRHGVPPSPPPGGGVPTPPIFIASNARSASANSASTSPASGALAESAGSSLPSCCTSSWTMTAAPPRSTW